MAKAPRVEIKAPEDDSIAYALADAYEQKTKVPSVPHFSDSITPPPAQTAAKKALEILGEPSRRAGNTVREPAAGAGTKTPEVGS